MDLLSILQELSEIVERNEKTAELLRAANAEFFMGDVPSPKEDEEIDSTCSVSSLLGGLEQAGRELGKLSAEIQLLVIDYSSQLSVKKKSEGPK